MSARRVAVTLAVLAALVWAYAAGAASPQAPTRPAVTTTTPAPSPLPTLAPTPQADEPGRWGRITRVPGSDWPVTV